jgi:hypothetical protein
VNEWDEETLRNLPNTLEGILILHRASNPNPYAGLDIRADGGPLDGQTFHNDGQFWQGDYWHPAVDGTEHRYVLGVRLAGRQREVLWFHTGLRPDDGTAI